MTGAERVLVTGGAGLLGRHLVASAPAAVELGRTWRRTRPPPADSWDHRVDLADLEATGALFEAWPPTVVIHTAYAPGDPEGDIVAATRHVARACAATGAALVHLSSDVVFDGEHAPYAEYDPRRPVSSYGVAKRRAEDEVLEAVPDAAIVRTSLLSDVSPPDPRTAWILDALTSGEPITLFTDELRCPVRADDLAARIWALLGRPRAARAGPWHLVGPDVLSRHDIGLLVARAAGVDPAPLRAGRSEGRSEPRPRDLRLAVTRADTPSVPNRSIRTLFGSAFPAG